MPVSLAALLLAMVACAGLEIWLERRAVAARGAPVPFTPNTRRTGSDVAEVCEIAVSSERTGQHGAQETHPLKVCLGE